MMESVEGSEKSLNIPTKRLRGQHRLPPQQRPVFSGCHRDHHFQHLEEKCVFFRV